MFQKKVVLKAYRKKQNKIKANKGKQLNSSINI